MITNYVCVLSFSANSRYHNAYDYYGKSDTETGLENKSVDAPDFRESRSSVNMSEVCMKSMLYERNVQP